MAKGVYKRGVIHRKPTSEETKRRIKSANTLVFSDEKIRKEISDRQKGNTNGFKKGYTPYNKGGTSWNKGLKGYRAGEKSHLWKGGITPINHKIRTSLEYKLWRESVFTRDNFTCIWCGDKTSGNLNADHIKPFAYFPELRFAIDNGRTLCIDCHKTTETYLKRVKTLQ